MNKTIKNLLEGMQDVLIDAIKDAEKFDNGNSAAGTRVRKYMQDIKNIAQDVRTTVSDVKNAKKA